MRVAVVLSLGASVIGACGGGGGKREPVIESPALAQQVASPPPAESGNIADASPARRVDADADAGTTRATRPWPDVSTCSFPPVAPAEGTTARQCCSPSPSVRLCLETMSLIHHHVVGPYTERTLTVTPIAAEHEAMSFPLDRQQHGSMRSPDVVLARLSFRVHDSGLELVIGKGCDHVCQGDGCSKEQKVVTSLCASAGTYRWNGDHLVRE